VARIVHRVSPGVHVQDAVHAHMSRAIVLVVSLLVPAIMTRAADWGMAQANAELPANLKAWI